MVCGRSRADTRCHMSTVCRFDLDRDNIISRSDMEDAVVHLGLVPPGESHTAVAEEFLKALQADCDGNVFFKDFNVSAVLQMGTNRGWLRVAKLAICT